MNKLFFATFLSALFSFFFIGFINSPYLNGKAASYSSDFKIIKEECIEKAANKIAEDYSFIVSRIDYRQINNYDNVWYKEKLKTIVIIRWHSFFRSYWIKGYITIEKNCCDISWKTIAHSESIDILRLSKKLNCTTNTDNDVLKSMGVGKPFKRKGILFNNLHSTQPTSRPILKKPHKLPIDF